MLVVNIVILLLSSALHLVSSPGYFLSICPVFLFVVLLAYERGNMLPGMRLEFFVETMFVLAGIVTLFTTFFCNSGV